MSTGNTNSVTTSSGGMPRSKRVNTLAAIPPAAVESSDAERSGDFMISVFAIVVWRRLRREKWRPFSPPPQSVRRIQLHALVIETSRANITPRAKRSQGAYDRTNTYQRPCQPYFSSQYSWPFCSRAILKSPLLKSSCLACELFPPTRHVGQALHVA